jgi:hypothetical protein
MPSDAFRLTPLHLPETITPPIRCISTNDTTKLRALIPLHLHGDVQANNTVATTTTEEVTRGLQTAKGRKCHLDNAHTFYTPSPVYFGEKTTDATTFAAQILVVLIVDGVGVFLQQNVIIARTAYDTDTVKEQLCGFVQQFVDFSNIAKLDGTDIAFYGIPTANPFDFDEFCNTQLIVQDWAPSPQCTDDGISTPSEEVVSLCNTHVRKQNTARRLVFSPISPQAPMSPVFCDPFKKRYV